MVGKDVGVVASVVIPTHRGAHRLPGLLEALAAQTFTGPWEAVVVVDGVVDDTVELVESYRDRVPVRLLVLAESSGVCRALNEGYTAAQGQVLIRCDDDLTPAPDMVERHVAWHSRPGTWGVIGPTRDVFPDTPYARIYGRPANARALEAAYGRSTDGLWVHWAAHNSLTRESWDRSGGFDERFVYGQDSEFGWRLQRQGVSMVVDPNLELPHRGPTTNAATRVPRAFVSGASRRLFKQIHAGVNYPQEAPEGLRARLWQRGTDVVATVVRSREGCRRLGSLVDWAIRWLPASPGRRLVAFAVEASSRSGLRHGPDDLSRLRSQKTRELSAELPSGGRTS